MPADLTLTINRSVVILKYQQPFLDWICSVEPRFGAEASLEELNEDNDAYLLPADPVIDGKEDAVAWIEKRWKVLFESKLVDWYTDEALWPKKRTLKMFREWFAVEYSSMVWDLDSTPIEYEDWSEED
jgi:hypothetical protein